MKSIKNLTVVCLNFYKIFSHVFRRFFLHNFKFSAAISPCWPRTSVEAFLISMLSCGVECGKNIVVTTRFLAAKLFRCIRLWLFIVCKICLPIVRIRWPSLEGKETTWDCAVCELVGSYLYLEQKNGVFLSLFGT